MNGIARLCVTGERMVSWIYYRPTGVISRLPESYPVSIAVRDTRTQILEVDEPEAIKSIYGHQN